MTLLDPRTAITGEMVEYLPIPPGICHACGKPYSHGCPKEHKHSAWTGCYDYDDVRTCQVCGFTVHKYCQKDGETFWFHRLAGDIGDGCYPTASLPRY